MSPDAAAEEWKETGLEDHAAVQLTQNAASEYRPSEDGYPVRLLDGKMSRLRFKGSGLSATGFDAEWRVANRNFHIPEACCLAAAAQRVTSYCSEPHQVIRLTPEAESWHLSYQGAMNVQSHIVRDSGDVEAAARLARLPGRLGCWLLCSWCSRFSLVPIPRKPFKHRLWRLRQYICSGLMLCSSLFLGI